ncbi:ABC transporter substrate-binding protein [Pseudomonas phoenicis]|uniref:ABC transporter substrate-binding protein n=1 Tax=unclassified Pseudomonas TaxID=196821 RepID=UPI0039A0F31F
MKALHVPQWLLAAGWLRHKGAVKVAACESAGENAIDLFAALYLTTRRYAIALDLSCHDDRRDAEVAARLARSLCETQHAVVVGHFGAVTALSACAVYDQHPTLFLAPGCSDPRLCSGSGPGRHAVRLFGNDDEQVDCLLAGIEPGARVSIFAQRANYGYRLGKTLHQRLIGQASTAAVTFLALGERPGQQHCREGEFVVIAGSCEFAQRLAPQLALRSGQKLLLSDDCRPDKAAQLGLRNEISVASLAYDWSGAHYAELAERVEQARVLTGRPPGPYFVSCLLACQALCLALLAHPGATPAQLRAHILGQRLESPLGRLSFDPAGGLRGHRWALSPVPMPACPPRSDCHALSIV